MSNFIKKQTIATRQGAASIYVVVFTTLVLSVITLSFVRIMISEAEQTSNYDLSQSAYDSALAGIEDAKVAILKYHQCLSDGKMRGTSSSAPGSCERIIYEMETGIASGSCDVIKNVLGRPEGDGGEVMVQETSYTDGSDRATALDQAYTCVTVSEELDDYRAYLSSDNRTRLIPVRTANSSQVNGIYFRWYSDNNGDPNNYMGSGKFSPNSSTNSFKPPVVAVDIYQTDRNYNLGELSVNHGNPNNGTDHAQLVLYPVSGGSDATNSIDSARVLGSSDKNGDASNTAIKVRCQNTADELGFYCGTYIEIPPTYQGNTGSLRNPDTFFFRVALLYGQPNTDFSISLCRNATDCSASATADPLRFSAVQARVDSTGRANDLYRRVETRIELVDTGFPYPEFVIQLTGTDDLEKSFWVARNCWSAEDGNTETCNNNDEVVAPF